MKKIMMVLVSSGLMLTSCTAPMQSGQPANNQSKAEVSQRSSSKKLTSTQEKDRQAIKKLNQQQNSGMVHKDVKLLRKITAKKAKFIHMDGVVQSRDSWINSVKTGSMTYYSGKTKSMTIELHGQTAKAIVHNEVTARINGTRGTWTLRSENNLKKRHGQWLITRSQSFSE
ncbi:nuclear transport factor 2 family protein [Lactiplantibacillus paraplantarum]|uniref:nuclear transport factor 2 family protein n=1 Tax=Lactiplantibacillus paraplantarum TaxID=60520 RepID=UPI0021A958D0|nr:nuclear transport factor 2 family protein [Lactiplantibacillus paraplantarum]